MPKADAVRLHHMREAASMALEMARGRDRSELSDNPMFAMAVTRCLEILGEAASKVTPEARDRFPHIPWAKMSSMRNRLIHAYFDVDLDIVWATITLDLPPLPSALDAALAEMQE